MDGHDRRNRPCRSHRLPGYSLFTCQRSSALELAPNGKACLSQSCLRASCRARLEPFSAPGRFRRNLRCAWRGSRQCAWRGGGGERDRTDDLLLAKQALSQLSYTPANSGPARVCRAAGAGGALAPREPAPCGLAALSPGRRAELFSAPCRSRGSFAAADAAPHERRSASFGGGPGRI